MTLPSGREGRHRWYLDRDGTVPVRKSDADPALLEKLWLAEGETPKAGKQITCKYRSIAGVGL